jgi:hypothetical protein
MNAEQIITSISLPLTVALLIGVGRWVKRAMRSELREVIGETVEPQIATLSERLDAHLTIEEHDRALLIDALEAVAGIDGDALRGRLERLRDEVS